MSMGMTAAHRTTRPASCTKIVTTAKDAIATPGNVYGGDSVNSYNSARLLYNDRNDAKERHHHPQEVYGNDSIST
ncbi:hypothetical protein M407DRAFT_32005 [Tulasnella calospora MUT 4182]|uniref:Uncharacterized protein n=1 Tax=Tulasnella calospora MUT 4182 TaxID=1051891 RepID=A0A0C3KAA3_9AGAM|nr:hypothetical protein M407DRAFT_32005 [Tulasnella calospora MUT 4182]